MRGVMTIVITLSVGLGAGSLLGSCGAETDELGPSMGTCPSGKCDGFAEKIDDYYSDMRSIGLDDLVTVGAGLVTEQLNDALSDLPYANIRLSETQLFGNEEKIFGQTIVHDINELKTGLTQALGEHAFATRIAEVRRGFLASAPSAVYAETHFQIGASLNPSWSVDVGGLPAVLGLVVSPQIETVLVAPYEEGQIDAVLLNPLYTIREARGFVLPRSLEDVVQMAPGEMMVLRGDGRLGFNVGVGVPLFLTTVAEFITLRARVSAAARVMMGGTMDVQLIRGNGMDAWVDVGVSSEQLQHFSLGLSTGWGIEGLPSLEIDLGPVNVDLANIMESALEDLLNKKLALFSATGSAGNSEGRLTVTRFKFDLAATDLIAVEQAMAQAMRGDLRLAQALANRPGSGVTMELDISRDSRSESSFLGFRFLGMSFYLSDSATQGIVQIDSGEQSQALLFSELEENTGFFFTDRTYKWREIVSLKSSAGVLTDAQVNARLVMRETDRYLSRDQLLDHLDPLLAYVMGFDAAKSGYGRVTDEAQRFVDTHCGYPPSFDAEPWEVDDYETCLAGLATNPQLVALGDQAQQAFDSALAAGITGGFSSEYTSAADLARAVFALKLGVSSTYEYPALWTGPKATVFTQVGFTDAALDDIMRPARAGDFRAALEQVLWLMAADRDEADFDEKVSDADDEVEDQSRDLDPVVERFLEAATRYEHLNNLVNLTFDEAELGNQAHLVLIPVDDPADVRLASIAEHKGETLRTLFMDLVAASGNLGEPEEFVIGYALMYLAWPRDIELLVDVGFDDDYPQQDLRVYTRGEEADLIDAGLFNVEELL